MDEALEAVLFNEAELGAALDDLAARIDADLNGDASPVILLGVMKGALYFLADLSRRLRTPHAIDTIRAASYGTSTESSGRVTLSKKPDMDLTGARVLIVDDIYDTGRTLAAVVEATRALGAARVDVCVLFSKDKPRDCEVEVRYAGLEIPDRFVIGYGLDYDERYRHLPYVGVLKTPASGGA